MGTSKSYSATIKGQPQWGQLSRVVTTSCGAGTIPNSNLANILSNYVNVIGGASNAGRGGSRISGRGGIRTAKRIGAFLGAFAGGSGIREALDQVGIKGLEGKTLEDIINQLIEYCSGPSNTIDDVAAKTASQKLFEELAENAVTPEDFEKQIKEVIERDGIQEVLIRYFSLYMFEHLSVMFYEKLVVDKGKTDCDDLFKQIKDYIHEKLKAMNKTNPIENIDWKSEAADRVVKNIQEDVLKVFENYGS
jgi:hypothetical protein